MPTHYNPPGLVELEMMPVRSSSDHRARSQGPDSIQSRKMRPLSESARER